MVVTIGRTVMGTAAVLFSLSAAPTPAAAEDLRSGLTERSVVRDRHGFRAGRVDRKPDGDLVLRDRHGFRAGRMQADGRGGYVVRDRHGFRTGRISPAR
ncbi:MAG TPA: hypothetical protein VGN83_20610 [Falsiroseomonas sp.]|jgi:hypothetical protein|nr:hypothetical protein [Falsiroseomonas sp.]